MSADNGVYILETPAKKGSEFRVAHLQAIDNLHCHFCKKHPNKFKKGCRECEIGYCEHKDCKIKNARQMWSGCEIFYSMDEAMKEADSLYDEVGYAEYGIQVIQIDRPFKKVKQNKKGDRNVD
jgi:hypothetical protein